MPIPYMGSKRASAGKIYQTIQNLNPESKIICDLFSGGFAISELFLKKGWQVISNDKNKYVVALIGQTIHKKLDEKKCLEFVSRDKFYDVVKNPDKYEDWYVGYIQCIWSFGNSQKNYLFGKIVEPVKEALHELVVNCNSEEIKKLYPGFPQKYIDGILKQKDWRTRRICMLKATKVLKTRIFELERLQRLQQLQQLEQLELSNLDYCNVPIPEKAIVYCDPPYAGTATYSIGGFDHNKFWNWVREKSKTHKVFVSEYNAPADFEVVLEFSRNSTLSGGQNKNQPTEKLFRLKK